MKDILTIIIGLVLLAVVWGGWVVYDASRAEQGGVACTLDAKICPDGSAVGRVAPNCEFAPCPGE